MIRVLKDLEAIPASLAVPPTTGPARTTHRARERIISESIYPQNNKSTDNRYKIADIKEALSAIYNKKCAFCEQRVEQWHVEHYRPKSIYYWLAFSWDNLLFACPTCNQYKRDNFRITGIPAIYDPDHLDKINTISTTYDAVEKPDLINPEREDPESLLNFREDGFIDSSDCRCKYTISTCCKIDRPSLNDSRKKIWDDFVKDLRSEILEGATREEILGNVSVLLRKFNRDAQNDTGNEFLAFRRFAIRNWLNSKIKELTA